uniref:Thioredoxin domain-containing protein n=1 Tax=candidate division WWE3 bacterium TaxID=2053526 RepID=A0A832E100_UNCKA
MRAKLNFSTEAHMRLSAAALEVTYEELKGYFDLSRSLKDELTARRKEAVRFNTLRRSGNSLLQHSPVVRIKGDELPADSLKPYIIYWSARWCFPCQLTKPTFARLARFFDRCPLFFGEDNNFRRVKFVPQLVAYLPDGSQIGSDCGGTTRELWDHLNLLVTLGSAFRGNGMLVCDEQGCRIEPAG